MVRACMYFETEANRASLGRNGAIVVGVGIVIGICPMCLQGAGNRQAGFLFRCPMLPQQRCCLRVVFVYGPPQGGVTIVILGVEVGAGLDEHLRHASVPVRARAMQRRAAVLERGRAGEGQGTRARTCIYIYTHSYILHICMCVCVFV